MEQNKVKVLTLKRVMDEKRAAKLKQSFLTEEHFHTLITEDTDGYDVNGNLLFRYRKNAIPFDLLKQGYDSFKDSIELTEGRGSASGSSHKRIRKDGSESNITVGNKVYSGNVGYMDAGAIWAAFKHYNAKKQNAFDKEKVLLEQKKEIVLPEFKVVEEAAKPTAEEKAAAKAAEKQAAADKKAADKAAADAAAAAKAKAAADKAAAAKK